MDNSGDLTGPFGRSFIGDFPTLGSILMLLSTFFLSALFSLGNPTIFLVLLIISAPTVVYISYNFIEPHFNSKPLNSLHSTNSTINQKTILLESGRPKHIISFQDSIRSFFINWSDYNGRSSRSEYNWIILFSFVINFILNLFVIFSDAVLRFSSQSSSFLSLILLILIFLFSVMIIIFYLFLIIPNISLTVRRIHDIGFSGLYLFLFIFIGVILYFFNTYAVLVYAILINCWLMCSPGEQKNNKYGTIPNNELTNKKYKSLKQIWDFSGNNFSDLFHSEFTFEPTSFRKGPLIGDWKNETKFRTWLIIGIIWFSTFISLYIAAFLPYIFIIFSDINSVDFYFTISLILQWLLASILILIILYFEDKFSYFRELFKIPNLKQSSFLILFVLILDFILITIYLLIYDFILGTPSDGSYDEITASTYGLLLLFVAIAVAAPIFEEILFRGYILDKIRNLYSDNFTIFSSGFLFGMMHWDVLAPLDFAQTGAAMIGGFLYAWLRIKTGSLWPSIICHSIWNGTIFLITFV